jgi:hypothetical protein
LNSGPHSASISFKTARPTERAPLACRHTARRRCRTISAACSFACWEPNRSWPRSSATSETTPRSMRVTSRLASGLYNRAPVTRRCRRGYQPCPRPAAARSDPGRRAGAICCSDHFWCCRRRRISLSVQVQRADGTKSFACVDRLQSSHRCRRSLHGRAMLHVQPDSRNCQTSTASPAEPGELSSD